MEQTNRTILFEEVNPNKGNLLTYIQDEMPESISDSTLQQIHNYLEVTSFEECLQKMQPVIYLGIDTRQKQVFCTLKEEEINPSRFEVFKIEINRSYPLLEYYVKLIEGRDNQVLDIDVKILSLMFPIQSVNEFLEEYTKIASLYIAGSRNDIEKKRTDFLEKYDNVLSLLYILFFIAGNELAKKNEVSQKIMLSEQKNMQVKIDKVAKNFLSRHIYMSDHEILEYQEWLEESLEKTQHKELFKEVFDLIIAGTHHELEILQQVYYESLDFWIRIVENFWNV